jgi:hypothetical protein
MIADSVHLALVTPSVDCSSLQSSLELCVRTWPASDTHRVLSRAKALWVPVYCSRLSVIASCNRSQLYRLNFKFQDDEGNTKADAASGVAARYAGMGFLYPGSGIGYGRRRIAVVRIFFLHIYSSTFRSMYCYVCLPHYHQHKS